MKISDINTQKDYIFKNIECKLLVEEDISNHEGRVETDTAGQFKFVTKEKIYNFKLVNKNDQMVILDKFKQGISNLSNVSIQNKQNKNSFFMTLYFFPRKIEFGEIEILVSDGLTKTLLKKRMIKQNEDYSKPLSEKFNMNDGFRDCFLFGVGVDKYPSESESDITDEDGQISEKKQKNEKFKKLIIYANGLRVYISIKADGDNVIGVADKIVTGVQQNLPPLNLGYGKISFVRETTYLSSKVKNLLDESSEYLDVWNQYSSMEGDMLLAHARKIGYLTGEITGDSRGYIVKLENASQLSLLSIGDQITFSDVPPVYLEKMKIPWSEYREICEKPKIKKGNHEGNTIINKSCKIIDIINDGCSIVVRADYTGIENSKYIFLNIDGNYKQIKRREDARNKIANGQSAMPTLGLILEGKGDVSRLDEFVKVKQVKNVPLTSFVKNKVFKHDPTDTQVSAIEIALNTPDIAIIQGPPGTGKTTVITAIVERLNELFDKRENIRGQVLITSFQHDAVENVIQRLQVNSLPTIKFGRRSNATEDTFDIDRVIDDWCESVSTKIRKKNLQISIAQEPETLKKEYGFYEISPNMQNAKKFLETAKKMVYDENLIEDINEILKSIEPSSDKFSEKMIREIMSIRVTKEGFADDGPEKAMALYDSLEPIYKDESEEGRIILETLKKAALSDGNISDGELKDLRKVRTFLLEKIKPRAPYKNDKPRSDIIRIFSEVSRSVKKPTDEKDLIIIDFLSEIENNPTSIHKALHDYSFVYSASTQQAVGKEIMHAKNKTMTYDTVVVDEAARVNPGDLMIPLTQAKRRIILVGDHRQLPHIYNDEIVEQLQNDNRDFKLENIEKSMFEQLLNSAKNLEKQDGIKRTITLDAQYRMHPLLGKFVCDNFYAEYGESFSSPLQPNFFSQSLMASPANWINVGLKKEKEGKERKEKKKGTSRWRQSEITVIVDKLKKMISSEEGKALTYGVISFYSAQVSEIKKALGEELRNRVRVGSVDAFQGMEFDVIFLSTVRTSKNLNNLQPDAFTEDTAIRTFGFMKVPNRLCVAMSRQKRLLIVVGDSELFESKLSEKYVPAMKKYYELCKENGGVFDA